MENENIKNENENSETNEKTEETNSEKNENQNLIEDINTNSNQEKDLNLNNANKIQYDPLNNENNEINTNINIQNNNPNENDFINYLNDLENISEYMDVEAYNKVFINRIVPDMNIVLNTSVSPNAINYIKKIFYFILKYLKIRLNYLKIMTNEEIFLILKIILPNNKIYIFNNFYQNDIQSINILEQNILFPILQTLCPQMTHIGNSYKKIMNTCVLYKYILEFLYQENFLNKFYEEILIKPEI